MKRISLIISCFLLMTSSLSAATKILDIDFTRDSVQWKVVFPELQLTNNQKDFSSSVSQLSYGDCLFSGSFGRFNSGTGTMAQPEYIENKTKNRRFAFRLDSRDSSVFELPEFTNVGRFTVFCKNENAYANSELAFFIQKKEGEEWVNLRTVYVPPHHNQNFELQMEEFLNINSAVKLRIFGATRKLHIYQVRVESYDPALPKEKPLKLILLPDPQSYLKQPALNPVYVSQPRWLNEIADSVKFVMCLGDITDDNSHGQWGTAAGALNLLEGKKIPFTFGAGNHDMGTGEKHADTRCTNLMNNYLPLNRYERHEYFGDAFEKGKIDNTWHTFSKGDYKFLLFSMEYAPRNKVLNWAKTIIEKHPKHNVIISTHSYLNASDQLIQDVSQEIGKHTGGNFANSGQDMWDKLVKLYPNCLLVFNGHIMGDGTGYKVGTGDNGNKVYQFLSNYQAGVEGLTQAEKNGMLRIVDLYPEQKAFKITAYSPYWDGILNKPDHNFYYTNVNFIKDDASGTTNPKATSAFLLDGRKLITGEAIEISVYNLTGTLVFKAFIENEIDFPETMGKGIFIVKSQLGNQKIFLK